MLQDLLSRLADRLSHQGVEDDLVQNQVSTGLGRGVHRAVGRGVHEDGTGGGHLRAAGHEHPGGGHRYGHARPVGQVSGLDRGVSEGRGPHVQRTPLDHRVLPHQHRGRGDGDGNGKQIEPQELGDGVQARALGCKAMGADRSTRCEIHGHRDGGHGVLSSGGQPNGHGVDDHGVIGGSVFQSADGNAGAGVVGDQIAGFKTMRRLETQAVPVHIEARRQGTQGEPVLQQPLPSGLGGQ